MLNSATFSAEAHSVAMVTMANYVCQGKNNLYKQTVAVDCVQNIYNLHGFNAEFNKIYLTCDKLNHA